MGEIKVPIWGEPTLKWRDITIGNPNAITSLLTVEENDIKGDGVVFRVPDPEPITFSFDVDIAPETIRTIRKLFKYRIPRKTKKKIKSFTAKYLGIKVKQLKFNLNVLNHQKRRKRYENE